MNLSQLMLGLMLGTTDQSVARWENAKNKIPGAADRMIRVLYGEHSGGNECVKEFLECLAKLDDLLDGELSFEDTEEGWQAAKAA